MSRLNGATLLFYRDRISKSRVVNHLGITINRGNRYMGAAFAARNQPIPGIWATDDTLLTPAETESFELCVWVLAGRALTMAEPLPEPLPGVPCNHCHNTNNRQKSEQTADGQWNQHG